MSTILAPGGIEFVAHTKAYWEGQEGLVSRLITVAPGFLLMYPLTKHALGSGYEGLQVKGRKGLGFGAWGRRATVTSPTQGSPLMSRHIYVKAISTDQETCNPKHTNTNQNLTNPNDPRTQT